MNCRHLDWKRVFGAGVEGGVSGVGEFILSS